MNEIKLSKTGMPSHKASILKALSTFWEERGWYDDEAGTFHSLVILEILEELATHPEEPQRDLLMSTLSFLDNRQSGDNTIVQVSSSVYLGHKDFKFEVNIKPKTDSHILNHLKEYLEEEDLKVKDHLARLHLVKQIGESLGELNISVKLDKALASKEIHRIKKAFPILNVNGSGEDSRYSLQYRLLLDDNEEYFVENKDFAGDRGYLKIKNRYIIFDDDVYPAIVKQKGLSQLDNAEVSALISNPTQSLFPAGTNTEIFDLSEYDQRVASFEFAPRVAFKEIISSNISWYDSDRGATPYIKIMGPNDIGVNVEVTEEALSRLISRIETSLESGIRLADGNPRPIQDDNGNWISASEHNLNSLRGFRDVLKNSKTVKKTRNPEGTGANQVAVLREVELPVDDREYKRISLNKELLAKFLKKGINLDPHQVEGVNWLLTSYFSQLGGVMLCDDMGLGKTLQLILFFTIIKNIEHVEELADFRDLVPREKPSFVVAPLVLIQNWASEIEKFVADEFKPKSYVLHGTNLKTIKKSDGTLSKNWWKNYDLILTNYSTFGRHQVDLLRYPFLVTFFDESQNIKNHDTGQSRAARGLNSEFVVCATGTPVEIKLKDLWSQMDTLKRRPTHPLGREENFNRDFETSPNGRALIRDILKINQFDGLMIRREKSLLREQGLLPSKIIHEPYYVRMSPFQEEQEKLIVQTNKNKPLKIIQNLQKLYQHPYLLSKDNMSASVDAIISDSPKLLKTLEILNEIKGKNEKVLIFTLWTQMQVLLQKVLQEKFDINVDIINGDTNAKSKSTSSNLALNILDRFAKKDGFNLLILSPLAAGAGLNITSANHVIHYGRWWNPAKEDQSSDRAYRKGQTKDVHIYYPVLISSTNEGFDQKLDQRVRDKRAMAYDVLTPVDDLDIESEEGAILHI